jgi:hypothetical protein
VGINKDKHARIIIMRPETILHSEAGYIFADCSRPTRFFLQFGGGPYMLCQQSAPPLRAGLHIPVKTDSFQSL